MGFPAQTVDGAEVYITSKTMAGGGSEVEVFTDIDGRVFHKDQATGFLKLAETEEVAKVDPEVAKEDPEVEEDPEVAKVDPEVAKVDPEVEEDPEVDAPEVSSLEQLAADGDAGAAAALETIKDAEQEAEQEIVEAEDREPVEGDYENLDEPEAA